MRRAALSPLRLAFALSGLLPLAGLAARPVDTQALVWTGFVAVVLPAPAPRISARRFLLAAIATGMAVELAAWAGHYAACSPEPALFHPQLGRDLLIGVGFYSGLGLTWAWLVRRFGFSVGECFAVNGAMGVFLEQQGAAFLAGLQALPEGALLWVFVFLIYGPMAAIPRRLAIPAGTAAPPRRPWHYPVAALAASAGAFAGTYAFGLVLMALGLLPEPRSICAAPFW
ncbi:MAG: hypothetical protein F9K34_11630 [Albidovulum sp.]|jgi:hypothetical protein|uniref:hypothetical protein n=1 Tax=Albidovulum sp. TaxID=1872424 RepID=UPI001328C031|nr:hypothetical protein [Defluviimonas sp.]KAB2883503.1 MAG: hypothetical protein F9K34_11630 [Defluviimonas sp.]